MPASSLGGVLLVVITAILIFIFMLFKDTNGSAIPQEYLDKRGSLMSKSNGKTATNEYLLKRVNFQQKPCQDFFQYACGKYTDEESQLDKATLTVRDRLINIVKEKITEGDTKAFKLAKRMFRSCLKHESNVGDLKNMITHLGEWALFNPAWNEKDFSLGKFFSKSMEIGYLPDSLFSIDIEINPVNRENIIAIRRKAESYIPLSTENFRNYFQNIFLPMFGKKMNINPVKMAMEAKNYQQTRKHIEEIYLEPNNHEMMNLSVVNILYNNIPWNEILGGIFKSLKLSNNHIIRIDCTRCLKSLNEYFNNASTKSLVTYLMGSFVFDTIIDADDDIMAEWLKYIYGLSKEKYCAEKLFDPFRRVLDYEYIKPERKYFDKSIIPTVYAFTHKLKTNMEQIISATDMMDSQTKKRAIAKVKEMAIKIAYDDEIVKGPRVLKYFDNLNINPKSYLLSLFNVEKFKREKLFRTAGKIVQLSYLEATAGGAEYNVYFNTLFISINPLTEPFYSNENGPEYLNFGGLGLIIAHEMNHAFDGSSQHFNKKGEIENWWNIESKIKYLKRIECIQEQYSNFINVETGHKVNGIQTLDENFSDIGGIEVAYKSYHELFKNQTFIDRESLLHESLQNFKNMTLQQMFWISIGASFCSKPSPENVLERENSDPHAEDRIRMNGMAINSKEFARDWNCEINTPMNPNEKCTVWK